MNESASMKSETAPTLPPPPALSPIQLGASPFLNVPPDIHKLIYDTLFPDGYTITVTLEIKSPFSEALSLFLLSSTLTHELRAYLATKPITLYCPAGHRPSVVHRIPRPILAAVEVTVIEDFPYPPLNLALLPGLKCVCFARTLESQAIFPDGVRGLDDFRRALAGTAPFARGSSAGEVSMPDARAKLLPLPENNALLKPAHEWWKDLRIECKWIRDLWKERKDIRVVLRSVMELEVPTGRKGEVVVFGYHSVVDVCTTSIIEKRYLPDHRKGEETVYNYGNARWWRR